MKKCMIFLVVMIMLLIGCGLSDQQSGDISEEQKVSQLIEENSSFLEESVGEDNTATMLPEWILPYTEIGQLTENIYLSRENTFFSLKEDNLSFPESNIQIVVKEIAGRDKEVIQNKREELIELINLIEKTEIIDETEIQSQGASLLGIDLSIVLLTADSEYVLMNFDIFDDNKVRVTTVSENSDNNINIWMKSLELVNKIKIIAEYNESNDIQFTEIDEIELFDNQGNKYQFAENEIKQMVELLKRASVNAAVTDCPYDIKIILCIDDEKFYAKFCNDSCKLLAIEGVYYQLEEQDANWILSIIDNLNGKNM